MGLNNVKIIGIGNCGCRNVDMFRDNFDKAAYVLIDTDAGDLANNRQLVRNSMPFVRNIITLQMGDGKGVNYNPEIAEELAIDKTPIIESIIGDAELVFIIVGLGGGTGTGASSVIAKCAKEVGATVIGVVTMPFSFEGASRRNKAKEGIEKLKSVTDGMAVFENEELLKGDLSVSAAEAIKLKYANYGEQIREALAKAYNM